MPVLMIMPEKPVLKGTPLTDLLQKIRQPVRLIKAVAHHADDAAGSTVGKDIIHIPAAPLQRTTRPEDPS